MNYGDIERQTFRSFLAFSTLLISIVLLFFNIASSVFRVSTILYDESLNLNYSSIELLKGSSIWLIDDNYQDSFYKANPSVERVYITKEPPDTLIIKVDISEKIAFVQDNRQSPPKTFIVYKNLYTIDTQTNEGLLSLSINNGPVVEGFFEELVTFVMTLKKYPINLSNVEITYDGESTEVTHFNSTFYLGSPSDLARKASVLGYYISEEPCDGDVRLFYSEDIQKYKGITNCN